MYFLHLIIVDSPFESNLFGDDDSENYHFEFLKTSYNPKTSTQKPLHEKLHMYHPYNAGEYSTSQLLAPRPKLPPKFTYKSASSKASVNSSTTSDNQSYHPAKGSKNTTTTSVNQSYHPAKGSNNTTTTSVNQSNHPSKASINTITTSVNQSNHPSKASINTITTSVNQSNHPSIQPTNGPPTSTTVCTKCISNEKLILTNTALLNALTKEVKYLRRENQNRLSNCDTTVNLPKLNIPAESLEDFNRIEQQLKTEEYELALVRLMCI